MSGKKWTREEMLQIAKWAGKVALDQIAKEVNKIGGNNRTDYAVDKKACLMGFSLVVESQ